MEEHDYGKEADVINHCLQLATEISWNLLTWLRLSPWNLPVHSIIEYVSQSLQSFVEYMTMFGSFCNSNL